MKQILIRKGIKTSSNSRKELELGNPFKVNIKKNINQETIPISKSICDTTRLKLIFYNSHKVYFTRTCSTNQLLTNFKGFSNKSNKNIIMPTKADFLRKRFIQFKKYISFSDNFPCNKKTNYPRSFKPSDVYVSKEIFRVGSTESLSRNQKFHRLLNSSQN